MSSLYISEIAEVSIRGALGALMPFMIVIGVIGPNALGIFMDWPLMTALFLIAPGLLTTYVERRSRFQRRLNDSFEPAPDAFHARVAGLPSGMR